MVLVVHQLILALRGSALCPGSEIVHPVDLHLVALQQLLSHVLNARCGCQRCEQVHVALDAVRNGAGLDARRPADQHGHPHAAFPRRCLLAAEGSCAAVRPPGSHCAIVGGIEDDGVVPHSQRINLFQDLPDVAVMLHHAAAIDVIARRIRLGEIAALRLEMGVDVHAGGRIPGEERLSALYRVPHERNRAAGELLVHCLHALDGEGAGVGAFLLAPRSKTLVSARCCLRCRHAVENAARPVAGVEGRILGPVGVLRLLLGVEVVEIAIEDVEAVDGGQMLVSVAKMVLAELAGNVALALQDFCECGVGRRKADGRARQAHRRQPGADRQLSGDEGGSARGAGGLRIMVGEEDTVPRQAVEIGCRHHHAMGVGPDVGVAHVVRHHHDDVGLYRLCLGQP